MSPDQIHRYRANSASMTIFVKPKTRYCTGCRKQRSLLQFKTEKSKFCKGCS